MFKELAQSKSSSTILNKVRNYIEQKIAVANQTLHNFPDRPVSGINLSIGDPSVYEDFNPSQEVLRMLSQSVDHDNGYVDFNGIQVII